MLSLDIETTNYSHEVGGWDKTPLFEPSVVATWDGETGTIYCKKTTELDGHISPNTEIGPPPVPPWDPNEIARINAQNDAVRDSWK